MELAGVVETRLSMFEIQGDTLQRLKQAEDLFLGAPVIAAGAGAPQSVPSGAPPSAPGMDRFLASIEVASTLSNYGELLKLTAAALAIPNLDPAATAHLLQTRALARFNTRDVPGAMQDWGAVASLPDVRGDEVATALYNRGVARSQMGDVDLAIEDFTRVVKTAGATVETIACALNNRGVAWSRKNESEREIADYSRVIDELRGASSEQVALALNNRGVAWGRKGENAKTIADCTRVIELAAVPVRQLAIAFNNRALAWIGVPESTMASRITRKWSTDCLGRRWTRLRLL